MSTRIQKAPAAVTYPLVVIKPALAACFALKIPAFMWGGVGIGKTSVVRQLCADMEAKMYALNLATMEPTDIGGHPFPQQRNGRPILSWIQAEDALPFVTPEREDEVAVVFADEIDRSLPQTQNPFMNLMREREINGRKLCPSVAVCCAGNGTTDTHTTPISAAMATRGVHFYVQTATPQALDSWDGWAEANAVAPWLRGFARYRQSIIVGAEPVFTELQKPTFRTICDAWQLMEFVKTVSWGREVIEPLVYGSVGQVVGREMIAFQRMFADAPTAHQIASDPSAAPIPEDIGVLWALGRFLMDAAGNGTNGEKADWTLAFAEYVTRWPEETQADWMRTASQKLPSLVGTKQYRKWESKFGRQ